MVSLSAHGDQAMDSSCIHTHAPYLQMKGRVLPLGGGTSHNAL